eukprot:CAMPEP_0197516070 /NCGR_PEP_ID=MMETSP1318-20131121/973_1 /TAXON_ID=552666 /ORGANISM="Partenskyella glossopodia, Strain RCC365" /LENGTH=55 /DNA_ID=CAMNT_0043064587 /DNA_START=383 /DNA_END=550 /DNA_ORIENTATION=-
MTTTKWRNTLHVTKSANALSFGMLSNSSGFVTCIRRQARETKTPRVEKNPAKKEL